MCACVKCLYLIGGVPVWGSGRHQLEPQVGPIPSERVGKTTQSAGTAPLLGDRCDGQVLGWLHEVAGAMPGDQARAPMRKIKNWRALLRGVLCTDLADNGRYPTVAATGTRTLGDWNPSALRTRLHLWRRSLPGACQEYATELGLSEQYRHLDHSLPSEIRVYSRVQSALRHAFSASLGPNPQAHSGLTATRPFSPANPSALSSMRTPHRALTLAATAKCLPTTPIALHICCWTSFKDTFDGAESLPIGVYSENGMFMPKAWHR